MKSHLKFPDFTK